MQGSVIFQNVCHEEAPRRCRGLLTIADLAQHGHDLADDEREGNEDGRITMPGSA